MSKHDLDLETLFDPVLVQIYNMEVSEYGVPFTLCRDHVEKLQKRLNKTTQGVCQVTIIALLPLNQLCKACDEKAQSDNGQVVNEKGEEKEQ